MGGTGDRKADHIRICLEEDVSGGVDAGWAGYRFDHAALPGIAFDQVDPSTILLGRRLAWPFLVGALTGGTDRAGRFNLLLARAAEASGCGMVLGSLRAALEDPAAEASFDVRAAAPGLPLLLGNLGAAQLARDGIEARLSGLCDRLRLDGVVVHLNPLQEALQVEGDRDWRGLAARIEALRAALAREGRLLGVKEVGSGFSPGMARWLGRLRPDWVETAGAGGTSFARVEGRRTRDAAMRRAGETFAAWGHPSVESLAAVRAGAPGVPVVASGGLRSGLDLARAIRLGASAGAMALPLLKAAAAGGTAAGSLLEALRLELRVAMFATGSRSLDDLRRVPMRGPDGGRVPFARMASR